MQNILFQKFAAQKQYLWAEYQGKVFYEAKDMVHADWFKEKGWPSWGREFDAIPRGIIRLNTGTKEAVISSYDEDWTPNSVFRFFQRELPGYALHEVPYHSVNDDCWRTMFAAAAPLDKVKSILAEMMADVQGDLPTPELKIANNANVNWLGRCEWKFGSPNTTVILQKSITHDETTMRRIIAHELAHHENFLNRYGPMTDYRSYVRQYRLDGGGHGRFWEAIADRWNAKYGAKYVTRTSDENTVIQHDVKEFYVAIWRDRSGIARWSTSFNLSVQAIQYLTNIGNILGDKRPEEYRLFKTTDRDFLTRRVSIGDGSYVSDAKTRPKAEELFNTGTDLWAQEAARQQKPVGRFFVLISKRSFGDESLMWQQAVNLTDEMKEKLGLYARMVDSGRSNARLVISTNAFLRAGARMAGSRWSWARTPDEDKVLEEAWNSPDLLPKYTGVYPKNRFLSSLLQKEAAPISDTMKSQIYFHGTGSEASAQAIMTDGIQPREVIMPDKAKSRAQLAPVPDRVYLTTDKKYAAIYALGGQMFGIGKDGEPLPKWFQERLKEGKYGYIFEIHGNQLSGDVVPDEDSIGDALYWLMDDIQTNQRLYQLNNGQPERWKGEKDGLLRSMEIINEQRINQKDVPATVRNELQNLYTYYVTDRQKQRLEEVATQAQVGKKLQKHLSQTTCKWMIENGAHVAHQGVIYPTACWRFDKEKAAYTRDLNSILERVSLPSKTANGPVDDPAFKTFISGTKIVGNNGRPKLVYHGTSSSDFDHFNIPAYFSDNLKYTKDFGTRTVRAYLNMKNPLYLDTRNKVENYRDEENPDPLHVEETLIRSAEWRTKKQAEGYDGVVITDFDGKDYNLHVYLPFSSDQIWIVDQGEARFGSKQAADGQEFWDRVQRDLLAGIVYHGTTLEIANIIQKDGFRGLEWDEILKEVLAKYSMTEAQIPKKMVKVLEQTKKSYTHENHLVSTSPGGEVCARWAGGGGEVPRQIEAYITGKYSTREVKESRLSGEPAVVKCQIKNFESTPNFEKAKTWIDGLNRLIASGGVKGEFSPLEAAEHIWTSYANFLCLPEQLQVLEVITGEQLQELKSHPLGLSKTAVRKRDKAIHFQALPFDQFVQKEGFEDKVDAMDEEERYWKQDEYESNVEHYGTLDFPVTIYRAVEIPAGQSINFDHVGVYWTWNEDSADAYWGSSSLWSEQSNTGRGRGQEKGGVYTIQAQVTNPQDVDWEGTIRGNFIDPDENEIRIQPCAQLKLIGVMGPDDKGYQQVPGQGVITAALKTAGDGIDIHPIDWKQPIESLRTALREFIEEGYVWLQTPFPVISKYDHPGGDSFSTEFHAKPVWDNKQTEMIDASTLTTMQPQVTAAGILYYLDNPEALNAPKKPFWWDEYPVIVCAGEMNLIYEGNHRAAASLVIGVKLKATVAQLSESDLKRVASHKQTPLSNTVFPNTDYDNEPELVSGEGTNGYANQPERVPGDVLTPNLDLTLKQADLEGDGPSSFFEEVENPHSVQPLRASVCKGAAAASSALPPSFEQFCEQNGGFVNLFNDIADPSSDWEQYGMFWDRGEQEEFDNLPDADKERIMEERAFNDWSNRYDEIRWQHTHWNWPLVVWRMITMEDIKQLKTKGVGVWWAFEEDAAEAHWAGKGSHHFLLQAEINENDVNWDYTISNNLHPSIGEDEKEIQLNEGARIRLTGWKQDNGPWQKPLPNWKVVTAGAGDQNTVLPRHHTDSPALHTDPVDFATTDQEAWDAALPDHKVGKRASFDDDYDIYEGHFDTEHEVAENILAEYAQHRNDPTYRMNWDVVPAARLIKIWNDYMSTGFVRDEKGIDMIAGVILTNIAKLNINTTLCGHSQMDPVAYAEDITGEKYPEDYFDNDNAFFEDENGQWLISDYALKPLSQEEFKLRKATTAEQKLQIIDHILNIIHARSDIASLFVQGGQSTLNRLAGTGDDLVPNFQPKKPTKKPKKTTPKPSVRGK